MMKIAEINEVDLKSAMFEKVCDLENRSNSERREIILDFLSINNISYTTQEVENLKTGEIGSNIIVNINEGDGKKNLIVAHSDVVNNAGGANDNAASIAVALELIKFYSQNKSIDRKYRLEFLFTDFEEQKMFGAKHYIANIDKDSIHAVINLDMCGDGDTIIFDHKDDPENELSDLFSRICTEQEIPFVSLQRIPPGDDVQFELAGIPSLSLAIIPSDDVDYIMRLAKIIHPRWSINRKNGNFSWRRILEIFKLLPRAHKMPEFAKRMHTPRDTSEFISEDAMYTVFCCTYSAIEELVA